MQIQLKASTGNVKEKQEILNFSRASARVCYSKYDFDDLVKEDSQALIERLLNSGHHSPFEHISLSFYIIDIPKIGAMILNNEPPYVTSEKSARYTKMNLEGEEEELYNKWRTIFKEEIAKKYPNLPEDKNEKLAMENARNLTSVFTPTKMLWTTSFRQLNYIMHLFDDFIKANENSEDVFNSKVCSFMKEFNEQLSYLKEDRLDPFKKKRYLRLFNYKEGKEVFSYVYNTKYKASFSYLAQAQRHRTIRYAMKLDDLKEASFFVPPILENDELISKWNEDIQSVKNLYPQGMLINIQESGIYPDFISKIAERLCGHAQLEIMNISKELLNKYVQNLSSEDEEIKNELSNYIGKAKCQFGGIKCGEPCLFGPKGALTRKI